MAALPGLTLSLSSRVLLWVSLFLPSSAYSAELEFPDGANILNKLIQLNQLSLHMAADMLFHVSLWRCQVQLRLAATSKHTHLLEKKSDTELAFCQREYQCVVCQNGEVQGEPARCENNRRIHRETHHCVISICYHNRGQAEENTQ